MRQSSETVSRYFLVVKLKKEKLFIKMLWLFPRDVTEKKDFKRGNERQKSEGKIKQ